MPVIGSSVLLDTNLVVRDDPQSLSLPLNSFTALYLPVPVLAELYFGAYRSARPEVHLAKIQSFLPAVDFLVADDMTAEHYGRIAAQLAVAGTPIPQNDVWIAALAFQHGLPLWTLDSHFQQVAGLVLTAS